MKTLKEMLEKRAELLGQLRAMMDEATKAHREFSDEEAKRYGALEAELDALIVKIERAQKLARIEADSKVPAPGTDDRSLPPAKPPTAPATPKSPAEEDLGRSLALHGWLLRQAGEPMRDEHRSACQEFGLDADAQRLRLRMLPQDGLRATMQTAIGSDGGFTVPTGFMARFDRAMQAFGGIRAVIETMRTETGEDLPWPTANDVGNKGRLLAEVNAGASSVGIAIGQQIWRAHQYTSDMIRLSRKLMRDNGVNLVGILADILGERIARRLADDFTTGTGAGMPHGIVNGSALGVTAALAASFSAQELLALQHSVDPAYRVGPSVGYMMHDKILQKVGEMLDGNGRYLFRDANSGPVTRIHGFPVFVNQSMTDTVATTNKTVLFGDFRYYKARDVGAVEIGRSDQRFFEHNEVAYAAFSEHDGKLLNPSGAAPLCPVKHLKQA